MSETTPVTAETIATAKKAHDLLATIQPEAHQLAAIVIILQKLGHEFESAVLQGVAGRMDDDIVAAGGMIQ